MTELVRGAYKTAYVVPPPLAVTGKSKAVRELELQYRLRHRRLDLAATALQTIVPATAFVLIAWLVTGSVDRLAGKFTFADIGIRFLGDIRMSEAVAYALVAGTSGWAVLERKLKGDTIERLSKRVVELETKIDPDRSSSRLTERGTTRPEDRKL